MVLARTTSGSTKALPILATYAPNTNPIEGSVHVPNGCVCMLNCAVSVWGWWDDATLCRHQAELKELQALAKQMAISKAVRLSPPHGTFT